MDLASSAVFNMGYAMCIVARTDRLWNTKSIQRLGDQAAAWNEILVYSPENNDDVRVFRCVVGEPEFECEDERPIGQDVDLLVRRRIVILFLVRPFRWHIDVLERR